MKIKRFIVAVVSLQLLDAGRCCPQRVTDYRTIVRGRHGGEPGHGGAAWSLDTAWTHDRWWLASCPVFIRKFSGMIPTLHGEHGERLSEKALESVLRLLIMSTEKS